MPDSIIIRRQPANTMLPARGQVCGAAEVDITPNLGFTMAGYSIEAKKAAGLHGRLFARALYLEDANGNKAALCYVDLMSASRYVLERAACFTAPACGISVERFLLAGTHTHTAPGHFYGNPLFDTFAQSQSGFDQAWADWVAEQIAAAVIQAAEVAVPAQLVVASEDLWGITQNRSYGAFVHNFDTPATWNQAGYPGQSAPALPRLRRRAVDPRVTVLVAVAQDGTCLGAFASFACHATCMGNDAALYTPDWPGYAVRQAGQLLADEQPVIAVALSAAGDVNGLQQRDKGDPAEPIPEALQQQGAGLAQYVGDQVGNTIAAVVQGTREHAVDFTLETRYVESSVNDRIVGDDPTTELSTRWYYGWPGLGGSEDGRTRFHSTIGFIKEGVAGQHNFRPQHPQHPKAPAAFEAFLQDFISRDCLELSAPPVFPLHTLRINSHLFATVPGEPTTVAAFQIEQALKDATGLEGVTILGYAGDYSGYFTTEAEYRAQHYEGAMTIYGRNATRHISARLVELLIGEVPPPLQEADILFTIQERIDAFLPEAAHAAEPPVAEEVHVSVVRQGLQVYIRFFTPPVDVFFASGYFIRLERVVEGVWQPVEHYGKPFDDQYQDMKIVWRPDTSPGFGTWEIDFVLPAELAHAFLRVNLPQRPNFRRLAANIPQQDGVVWTTS